ncbi:MAG: aminoacyl--tRNA ligase-related protein [Candidatus Altiarchaeota archaeon]
MKLKLDCAFTLSKKVEDNILYSILAASSEVLGKGAPSGEDARITRKSVKDNVLSVTIESGTYVRPHDAAGRLKNYLSEKLGREHHVGVKELTGLKYELVFDVEAQPTQKVSIPFASKISFKESECTLVIEDLSEEFLRKNFVDRMINLVREKVSHQKFGTRTEHHRVIYEGKDTPASYNSDPSEELLSRKWIKRTPHRNQFVFGPQITELSAAVKRAYVDVVYKPLGFVEMMFPKLVDWSIWKKSGHARALYHSGFNPYLFITPKSADPGVWEGVSDKIKITGEIPLDDVMELLEPPGGGLAFAQCPPFWTFLEGETVADESLPIKVFDWSGPTYRYESGGAHGFERVDELHRIETLWVGTSEQVHEINQKLKERFRVLMEEVLELKMREAWVTPWFMEQKGAIDEEEDEMIVGTVDFEALLPYDGRWLEVQNCSNNGDSYPKAFNAKGQKGGLCSGCAGGSFERYLSAFLAQKGFDPDNWPEGFRKYLTSMPGEIKFL